MAEPNYPGPENIWRQVLPNGITLLAYENFASETVVINGVIRAGALAEDRQRAGLANFTAASLMRGTSERDFSQIYEELESAGASLGFSGGDHTTGFSAHGLAEDSDLLLELLSQSLRQPVFPDAEIEQVRGEIMTGLHMRANDTRSAASLAFGELLYGNHPYGRSTLGYLDSVSKINVDDIVGFHKGYYGPKGMIICVVGAITSADATAKIQSVFGDWEHKAQQPLPQVPEAPWPPYLLRTQKEMPDKSQSDVVLGLPGPPRSAPDYLDASLMNTVLGVFGMMGRIGKSVREDQGLAYYAYSRLQGGLGPSPWYVSAGVSPDMVEQAIDSIRHEIELIRTELVPEDELADSQAYRTGSMPVGLETNGGLASVITDMELYGLGLDYLQRYPEMVHAITPERIQQAARNYLSSEQLAIAVAGPPVPDNK